VQWAKTPREVVKTAIAALLGVSSHVGIVINRVNLAKHARYGYGDHGDYYSRYRGYYGSVAESPAPATRPPLTLAKR
jgi:succinoglycan biosynthesis transport protein ExoP